MKHLYLAAALVASCVLAKAQDFDHYQTLLPQGSVPKDFTERSSVKVAVDISDLNQKKEKGRVRKAKQKFVLESTYGIDGFLTGGSVLFNDEISNYLAAVLEEVLKPYPELQNKIRIYAVKSSVVNAYTTNNGIIFVNLGLLSRLENEAQLAFILSHEVIHYQKKHVINAYVNNVEIRRGRGDYRNLSLQDKSLVKSRFSQELESEADLGGAEIFFKSAYKKDSIHLVFDILKTAEYPLTWGRFDNQVFEAGQYLFPIRWTWPQCESPKLMTATTTVAQRTLIFASANAPSFASSTRAVPARNTKYPKHNSSRHASWHSSICAVPTCWITALWKHSPWL